MHYVQTQYCIFVYFCSRPPHGGRGLKYEDDKKKNNPPWSPSPRRAWIEIEIRDFVKTVDNGRPPHGGRGLKCYPKSLLSASRSGRPPHGGRGLKCILDEYPHCILWSPSTRKAQSEAGGYIKYIRKLTTVFLLFWSSVF